MELRRSAPCGLQVGDRCTWGGLGEPPLNIISTSLMWAAGCLRPVSNLFVNHYAGERSDPDSLAWAQRALGVPVIDHWWQTELGWPAIANCKGIQLLPTVPGSSTKPVPGWSMRVVPAHHGAEEDESMDVLTERLRAQRKGGGEGMDCIGPVDGDEVEGGHTAGRPGVVSHEQLHEAAVLPEAGPNELGPLLIRQPLPPGSLIGLWNNDARFKAAYTDRYPGYFETVRFRFDIMRALEQRSAGPSHGDSA